jgi:hypothetical protein
MAEIITTLNTTGVNNFFVYNDAGKPIPKNENYKNALDCSKVEMSLDQLLLFKIQ